MSVEQYNSNDWLTPVGEKTLAVLSCYPKDKAIKIASVAVFEEVCSEHDIPWIIIRDQDPLNEIIDKLEKTFRAPDGVSIANNLELRSGVNDLKRILFEAEADTGILAAHAAWHMLKVTYGNQDDGASIYQDLARRYPQYVDDWISRLIQQFGSDRVEESVPHHLEFFRLMSRSRKLAEIYTPESIKSSDETVTNFLTRAFLTAGEVGFKELTKMLDHRLIPYRTAAYRLRGLELPNGSAL